jgi:hypothetical protein
MRLTLMVAVLCCSTLSAANAQDIVSPETKRDLAECKMGALRLHRWDRDSWDASTPTGQYLVACMQAKGYRRRSIGWNQAYNPMDEVFGGKKPLYRSKEAEWLVLSGCYGDSDFNIAIEECWQK